LSRPVELLNQLYAVDPVRFPARIFREFEVRYCAAHSIAFGHKFTKWDTSGSSHLQELHLLLSETVMIRRTKKQVLTQLPPKARLSAAHSLHRSSLLICLPVSMNVQRRTAVCIPLKDSTLNQLKRDMQRIKAAASGAPSGAASTTTVAESDKRQQVMELYKVRSILRVQFLRCQCTERIGVQRTGTAKIAAVIEYVADVLESDDEKFILFAHHKDVLDSIEQFLQQRVRALFSVSVSCFFFFFFFPFRFIQCVA
jgi:SNF2 family DNA or RNA helicase